MSEEEQLVSTSHCGAINLPKKFRIIEDDPNSKSSLNTISKPHKVK